MEADLRNLIARKLDDLTYIAESPTIPLYPTRQLADAQRSLTHNGDTFDLGDGLSLRLKIEADDVSFSDVEDPECFGRVEWGRSQEPRPSDFDGRARIVARDGGQVCWWQPPHPDVIGTVWDDETMRKEAERVGDRVQYGYSVIILELLLEDEDGDEEEIESAVLGSVDEMYDILVCDLAGEIAGQISDREERRLAQLREKTCHLAHEIAKVPA